MINQSVSPSLVWRRVVNPEQDDSHVVNPEQIGEFSTQVFWDPRVRAVHYIFEELNACQTNWIRSIRKRIKRTVRMGRGLEMLARKVMVRLLCFILPAHSSVLTCL